MPLAYAPCRPMPLAYLWRARTHTHLHTGKRGSGLYDTLRCYAFWHPRLHQGLLTLCPQALICIYIHTYIYTYIYMYIYILRGLGWCMHGIGLSALSRRLASLIHTSRIHTSLIHTSRPDLPSLRPVPRQAFSSRPLLRSHKSMSTHMHIYIHDKTHTHTHTHTHAHTPAPGKPLPFSYQLSLCCARSTKASSPSSQLLARSHTHTHTHTM